MLQINARDTGASIFKKEYEVEKAGSAEYDGNTCTVHFLYLYSRAKTFAS